MKKIYLTLLSTLVISGCAELTQIVQQVNYPSQTVKPLTESDIVAGLKEALVVGTDTAVKHLAALNGYYGNPQLRINLPPESEVIISNISKIPGGDKMVQDLVIKINRSAEEAAKEAAPIFVNAITQMTITDAWSIYKGSDSAATHYLRQSTYNSLVNLYQPKIKGAIDKPLIGGISATKSWNTLTQSWNAIATSPIGKLYGYETVNTQLDLFLTQKALDGLFVKVAEQEKNIRRDPMAQVTDLLRRIFNKQ